MAWKKIKAPQASLMIAKELADLTQFVPGVKQAKFYLSKALNGRIDKVSFVEAVNSTPLQWREKWFKEQKDAPAIAKNLCPILSALYWSTIAREDWIEILKREMGREIDLTLPAPELSAMLYHEAMLVQACNVVI